MKALSIRQPWAWLIVNGYKDIENRTWRTNFRGRILIHTGKQFDYEGYGYVLAKIGRLSNVFPSISSFPLGGIVGKTNIIECVDKSDSVWFSGPYGFVLQDSMELPFMPCIGKLSFFNIKYEEPDHA